MVRYVTMKRITQILASVLFVITVLTLYLAFDFAINSVGSHKNLPHKRSHHEHDHNYEHDDIKITRKRSTTSSILRQTRKNNQTRKHQNEDENHNSDNNERPARNIKQKSSLNAKPGNFHKGKTGVKVNKPPKSNKEQRKRISTSTMQSQKKNKHHLDDKGHV